jgi:cyclohexanecarboxylate-CoA ligase
MLGKARSRVLVTAANFRGFDHAAMALRLREELPDLEHVVVARGSVAGTATVDDLFGDPADGAEEPGRAADDPVVLLYASGTESDPKGAVHSHNTLGYEDRSIIAHFGLTVEDLVFMPSPVARITGVLYGFHLATMLGSTVVYQDVWEPGEGLRSIERERCSFAVAATPFLHGLTHHERLGDFDVSSLRMFACGGADVPPDLIRVATARLGCLAVRAHGSTELPTLSAGHTDDDLDARATTDGRPIGPAQARVVDESGQEMRPGSPGLLLARGPDLFLGYLSNDAPPVDAEGWFATGDIAVIEEGGHIRISGRSKDIIVRGGETSAPRRWRISSTATPTLRTWRLWPSPIRCWSSGCAQWWCHATPPR